MTSPETANAAANPGYERRDVRIAPLVWLGLTIFVGTTAVFVVLWFLLAVLENQAKRGDPQPSPLAQPERLPPKPRLQESPVEDLQTLVARDEAILSSYGWGDEERQTVRIPISRAIDLAVERGLPQPTPSEGAETQNPDDR
jgi:hypothetical protein